MSCRDGALRLDADTGDVLLSPDAPSGFEWIVGGHQVGAQWEEKEQGKHRHLGGPLPVHANDSSLRLWLAVDQDKNDMVVVLTLSVKSRSKSKARPRTFFLVVPAEDLRITSAINRFQPLPLDAVPEALFERPADAVSANATRILHASFNLGHKRSSGVVMSTRPYSGQLRGTPLALLDGLKSLSEARRFDVYLKFSSYAQVGFQRMYTQITTQNIAFFTPEFDLTNMYRGGWHGGFDLWEAQGWHDECEDVSMRKRKASCLSPREQSPAPPAYAGNASPAPAYADKAALPLVHVPCTPRPEHQKANHTPLPDASPRSIPTPGSIVHDSIYLSRSPSGVPATPYSPHPLFSTASTEKPSLISEPPTSTLSPPINLTSLLQRYDREMGIWFLTAWTLIPNIHITLLPELLAIATAVAKSSNHLYRDARIACAKRFASCVADVMQTPTATRNLQLEILNSEPDGLIEWLFSLREAGDVGFMELLGKLEVRKREALGAVGEQEFGRYMDGFMVVRAAVVLQALLMEAPRRVVREGGGERCVRGLV